ncbi:MAG: DUF1572 family protein [Trueperaceae bacterium]|nr:MAG: DUF1572 family protein [Trueperaceae bacterium]
MFSEHYLETVMGIFARQKRLAERALAQLEPADYHRTLDPESNSLAIIIKHMAGNMRSRWRDFLTSDGEKPDRNRDGEFVDDVASAEALTALWEEGWEQVFGAVGALTPDDLLKTVTIRGKPHSVVEAIERQVDHYGQHVGQIIMLTKHFRGESWQTLSIPRGQSETFDSKQAGR